MLDCWLAGSYLDAGEVEQAAASLGMALVLADSTASPRTDEAMAAVLRRLRDHQGVPAVRELLARTSV